MKKITIYTAYAGHDTWDGASWSKIASFSNREDACKANCQKKKQIFQDQKNKFK